MLICWGIGTTVVIWEISMAAVPGLIINSIRRVKCQFIQGSRSVHTE